MVMVDGTEVPREPSVGYEDRKAAWSGKTKDHGVKATVVADGGRQQIWFVATPRARAAPTRHHHVASPDRPAREEDARV